MTSSATSSTPALWMTRTVAIPFDQKPGPDWCHVLAGDSVQLVDDLGCAADLYLLNNPEYIADLESGVEVWALPLAFPEPAQPLSGPRLQVRRPERPLLPVSDQLFLLAACEIALPCCQVPDSRPRQGKCVTVAEEGVAGAMRMGDGDALSRSPTRCARGLPAGRHPGAVQAPPTPPSAPSPAWTSSGPFDPAPPTCPPSLGALLSPSPSLPPYPSPHPFREWSGRDGSVELQQGEAKL